MHIKYHILLFFTILSVSIKAQKNELVPLYDSTSHKYGYVYTTDSTKFIIKPKFESASDFHNNFAKVMNDSLYCIVNNKGGYVFKPRYKNISLVKHNFILASDSLFYIANVFGEPIFEITGTSINWQIVINKIKKSNLEDADLINKVISMTDFKEIMEILFIDEDVDFIIIEYFNTIISEKYKKTEIHFFCNKKYKYTKKQF